MKKSIVALVVGLLVGLAFVWSLQRGHADGAVTTGEASGGALQRPPNEGFAGQPGEAEAVGAKPALTVHVVRSGASAQGAAVSVQVRAGKAWVPVGREVTDAHGDAQFPARAGRYVVSVHLGAEAALRLIDVPVSSEPTQAELVLGGSTVARGRVLDAATHAPVPGATVVWLPLDGELRLPAEDAVPGTADGLGRFSLQLPLGVGDDELEARAPGYAPASAAWNNEPSVDLELKKAARVTGVVVDEAGAPVGNAVVRSRPDEDLPKSTGADGRFELQVPAGGATVHALGPSGLQATARLNVPPGERREVKLTLVRGTSLEGFVHDVEGKPVPHADVRVLAEPDDVELAHLSTSEGGLFTAQAIPAGRYSLVATVGEGGRGRAVGYEHPAAERADVRVMPSATLAGRVTNEHGEPLASVTVKVSWQRMLGEADRFARTGADGTFELTDLLPAEVTVDASLGDVAQVRQLVMTSSGEVTRLELALGAVGTLKGHVEPAKGAQREVYTVFIGEKLHNAVTSWTAHTDLGGDFTLKLPAGQYMAYTNGSRPGAFMPTEFTVRAGEVSEVVLPLHDDLAEDGGTPDHLRMFTEVGTGLSFENGPGGVVVSFLMQDCPAAKAGLRMGDLVVSIDGAPLRDSLDAFGRMKKALGTAVQVTVRREGADLALTVK